MNITLPTIVIKQNKKKENSATHSKKNLESADSCKPLSLVVLLIERFFVPLNHAPLHTHTETSALKVAFLIICPSPHQINKTVKFSTPPPPSFSEIDKYVFRSFLKRSNVINSSWKYIYC